jgi:adenine-specific DNA-methyltransferase
MHSLHSYLNTVQRADCLTLLPTLPEACVDFVLTDPPYLARYTSRDGRSIAGDDNDLWLTPAFEQIYRVLKPHRFCISFYGWPHADKFITAWRAAGFRIVGHLVWPKRYASQKRFVRYQHEQAYLLAKGNPRTPATPIGDVLEWQYTGNRYHPTQKPLCALKPLIRAFSRPRDVVLDPFCGSGSTLLAAKLLDRRYLGIELEQRYWQLAQQRLQRNRRYTWRESR